MEFREAEIILLKLIELDQEISKRIKKNTDDYDTKITGMKSALIAMEKRKLEESRRLTMDKVKTLFREIEEIEKDIAEETKIEIERLNQFIVENKDDFVDELFGEIIFTED